MSQLEAGPEMDQAVNIAVGFQTEPLDFVKNDMSESHREAYYACHRAPSTDLNAAVKAAERNGLTEWRLDRRPNGAFQFRAFIDGEWRPFDLSLSAAEAICFAILALKK